MIGTPTPCLSPASVMGPPVRQCDGTASGVVPSLALRWSHATGATQGRFKGSAQRLGELTSVGELTRRAVDEEVGAGGRAPGQASRGEGIQAARDRPDAPLLAPRRDQVARYRQPRPCSKDRNVRIARHLSEDAERATLAAFTENRRPAPHQTQPKQYQAARQHAYHRPDSACDHRITADLARCRRRTGCRSVRWFCAPAPAPPRPPMRHR